MSFGRCLADFEEFKSEFLLITTFLICYRRKYREQWVALLKSIAITLTKKKCISITLKVVPNSFLPAFSSEKDDVVTV